MKVFKVKRRKPPWYLGERTLKRRRKKKKLNLLQVISKKHSKQMHHSKGSIPGRNPCYKLSAFPPNQLGPSCLWPAGEVMELTAATGVSKSNCSASWANRPQTAVGSWGSGGPGLLILLPWHGAVRLAASCTSTTANPAPHLSIERHLKHSF